MGQLHPEGDCPLSPTVRRACSACGEPHPEGECSRSASAHRATDLPALSASLAPAPEPPSLVGQTLGEYRVTSVLGEGGMGTVYRGVHPLIGKQVALKVLKPALSHDPELTKRFLAEAQAANKIGHRNIVDVFAFGTLPDGSQYFAMELLDGCSLGGHLAQVGRLGWREARHIFAEVFDGLQAAHERGVVHRDLKPDNVFLVRGSDGSVTVKLLDFGIAKFTGGGSATSTQTGVAMGTPHYMSPEHCRGRDVDVRSDLYSLGVMLFEAFTARLPFEASSPYEVISAQLTATPPSPRDFAAVPVELERLILRCLSKEKEKRPASVEELRLALLPMLDRLADSDAAPGPLPVAPTPRWRKALWVAVPVAAAALGLTATLALSDLGHAPKPAMETSRIPDPVRDPPPASAPDPMPAPAEAPPRTVTIEVKLTPMAEGATLFVDGQQREALRFQAPFSDTRPLSLRLEARGFRPWQAEALPSADRVYEVALERLADRPPAKASPKAAPPVTVPPVPPERTKRVQRADDL
ncbi:MAG: serine/threonine-protein kinase [Myxococcales bacterium]